MAKTFDINNYDDVFDFKFKYKEDMRDPIEQRRLVLDGLFVDKILLLLPDVKRRMISPYPQNTSSVLTSHPASKVYPPKLNKDPRDLHKTIVDSKAAAHTKLSLLYYLLLDLDSTSPTSNRADTFADKAFMPERYRIFMTGLWYMDRLDFSTALENLTHPSLIPTFQEEILETLVKHSPGEDMSLALAYYHTVQPVLSEAAIDVLFTAIVRTSVTEAFYFLRGQPSPQSEAMFEKFLSIVIHEPLGTNSAIRGTELINLPFSAEEEQKFEDYLISGAGKRVQRSRDFVMMRRIAMGRFSEALNVNAEGGKAVGGLNWERLQGGIKDGLGGRGDLSKLRS